MHQPTLQTRASALQDSKQFSMTEHRQNQQVKSETNCAQLKDGWSQGPSKVGASFSRKLPSEKKITQEELPPPKWTSN